MADLHRTAVGQLERGERVARSDTLFKLCESLAIQPSDLFEGLCWTPAEYTAGQLLWAMRTTHRPRTPRPHARTDPRPACHARAVAGTQAIFYCDSRGAEPVNEFIDALPAKRAAKLDDFIEEHLNDRPSNAPPPEFPITSQIEGELRELRVRFANTRYRILYQRSENLIVLLHAFEKDTGAVPGADKELAKRRMEDFKKRMDTKPRKPPRAAGRDAPPGHR